MNVLAKIVIPRSILSIEYIIDVLEELAREDFYRLKKILQNKRKKVNKCNHEEPVINCPACERMRAKQKEIKEMCIICGALLHSEEETNVIEKTNDEKEANERKLDEFKAQIGDIVELTKEIEEEGIVSASVHDFLKTAELLKQKLEEKSEIDKLEPIPSETPLEKLCDSCKMRFEIEQAAKNLPQDSENLLLKKSVASVKSERQLPEANVCEIHAQMETDLELGTFETEVQEITQVIRVRNEDGSVTEERKVIRIKREIRAPIKSNTVPLKPSDTHEQGRTINQNAEVSNESTPYCHSNTVGAAMVKNSKISRIRTAKSEVIECSAPMADPIVRSCLSTMSLITLESNSINLSFMSNADCFSADKIRELTASSTNFEEILRLFELHTQNDEVNSTENVERHENTRLTESERNLISKITNNQKVKSKSNNNVREEIKKKPKKTTSLSFKRNDNDESQSNENV